MLEPCLGYFNLNPSSSGPGPEVPHEAGVREPAGEEVPPAAGEPVQEQPAQDEGQEVPEVPQPFDNPVAICICSSLCPNYPWTALLAVTPDIYCRTSIP